MLGKRIMAAREKRGLSRTQVAEGMGVSESLVGRWERGERKPTTKSLPKLAQLLGVPVGTLLKRVWCRRRDLNPHRNPSNPETCLDRHNSSGQVTWQAVGLSLCPSLHSCHAQHVTQMSHGL